MKLRNTLAACVGALALAATSDVLAQQSGGGTSGSGATGTSGSGTTYSESRTDKDHNWGWIGLLGLAGLAGLRRKDDNTTYRRDVPGRA